MNIIKIGEVISDYARPSKPSEMRKKKSRIIIKKEYIDGLYRIEEDSHLLIVFSFHLNSDYDLISKRRHGGERGVFSSRSPRRPSSIGVTTVKLLDVKDNILTVEGLDAINGTPILDIKPHANNIDCP